MLCFVIKSRELGSGLKGSSARSLQQLQKINFSNFHSTESHFLMCIKNGKDNGKQENHHLSMKKSQSTLL